MTVNFWCELKGDYLRVQRANKSDRHRRMCADADECGPDYFLVELAKVKQRQRRHFANETVSNFCCCFCFLTESQTCTILNSNLTCVETMCVCLLWFDEKWANKSESETRTSQSKQYEKKKIEIKSFSYVNLTSLLSARIHLSLVARWHNRVRMRRHAHIQTAFRLCTDNDDDYYYYSRSHPFQMTAKSIRTTTTLQNYIISFVWVWYSTLQAARQQSERKDDDDDDDGGEETNRKIKKSK